MRTELIDIKESTEDAGLQHAAEILKRGGLVVFPTETVYGLGAVATNLTAVTGIFQAKGRPADNPLIVHVADYEMIKELVADPQVLENENLRRIMEQFWPGPLTIIFEKSSSVGNAVSAGLSTVGIRMPANETALKLIRLTGAGIAAPSANTSGKPSPTAPQHVIQDMIGKVDAIICGGTCKVGLESTVLDMTCDPPVILRPGAVTKEQLQAVLGREVWMANSLAENEYSIPKAPGMKYRHYAPKGAVTVFMGNEALVAKEINRRVKEAEQKGLVPRIIATQQTVCYYEDAYVVMMGDRNNPETIASMLFSALRTCDEQGADLIFAEAVSREGIGEAIMNRLVKAAGYALVNLEAFSEAEQNSSQ